MDIITASIYLIILAFYTWLLWQGEKTQFNIALFSLTGIFLLNALHFGFIFTNEDEGTLTSFGEALCFALRAIPDEAALEDIMKIAIIRLLLFLTFGYSVYFTWKSRLKVRQALKVDGLQTFWLVLGLFFIVSALGIYAQSDGIALIAALIWAGIACLALEKSGRFSFYKAK